MNNDPDNTGEIQATRDNKGRFIEGISGNRKGKPQGSKNYLTLLSEALKEYETEKGKSLFIRYVERAFVNDRVLISLMKKFIPDKTHMEAEPQEGVHIFVHHVRNKEDVDKLKELDSKNL